MWSLNLSHISKENEFSMGNHYKNILARIIGKEKVVLSEQKKSDRIEFICFLLPLVVTALAIIFMLILYKTFM